MFGLPESNVHGFEIGTIGDVVKDVHYGTGKKASEDGKYIYIRMNNITYEGELDLSDIKRIDVPDKELAGCIVQQGDVLFNRTNSKDLVGKTCYFSGDEPMIIAGYIICLRMNGKVIPEYLSIFMNLDRSKKLLYSMAKGAVGQANINAQEVQSIEIVIPPYEMQKEFLQLLKQSDKSKFVRFKSQFIEMFYDKGYPVKTIGEVIDKKIARVGKVFEKTSPIQYLDISSIDNSSKTVTGLTPYVLAEAPSRAQYVLKQNDIMYSTVRPNLQNIAINPYSDDNVVGSTGFCVLRCIGVTTGYMWGVINSIPFTEAMVNQASGANYPAVTDKVVHAYEIPIPPESEQNAYEELVRQSDKSK